MALAKLTMRLSELAWLIFGAYLLWLPEAAIKMSVTSRGGQTPTTGKMLLILVPAIIIGNEWQLWRTTRHPQRGWGALSIEAVIEIILIGLLLAEQFGLA